VGSTNPPARFVRVLHRGGLHMDCCLLHAGTKGGQGFALTVDDRTERHVKAEQVIE